MRFLLILSVFVFTLSCDKDDELEPSKLKKVLLLKINYLNYKFSGGKEFAFTANESSSDTLTIFKNYTTNDSVSKLTLTYGINYEPLFEGTEIINGQGKIIYPSSFDNSLFYYKISSPLTKPENSKFQLFHTSLPSVPIQYDSIWKAISNLEIVQNYQTQNPTSRIGLFLFRPSVVAQNPGDWKWFLIFRE